MSDMRETKIEITCQGAIVVSWAQVIRESEEIACIEIDLESKCADCFTTWSNVDPPSVILFANDNTRHLHPDFPKDSFTNVLLCEFNGWEVFCHDIGRYTCSIVLIKHRSRGSEPRTP
jgi:hypothetical protein